MLYKHRNSNDDTRRPTSRGRIRERGQTLMDFALSMSVFLILMAFVVLTIQTNIGALVNPANQGMTGQAERIESVVVEDYLSQPGHAPQTRLSEDCTKAFFDGTDLAKCEYDGGSMEDAVALREYDKMNVKITDPSSGNVPTIDSVALERGPSVPGTVDKVSKTRVVELNGNIYYLTVTVW